MGTHEKTDVPDYSFHHITVQRSLPFEDWRGEKKRGAWGGEGGTLVLGQWLDTSVWYMESIQVVNFYTLLTWICVLTFQAYWDNTTSRLVNIKRSFLGTYSMYRVSLPSLNIRLWRWKPNVSTKLGNSFLSTSRKSCYYISIRLPPRFGKVYLLAKSAC